MQGKVESNSSQDGPNLTHVISVGSNLCLVEPCWVKLRLVWTESLLICMSWFRPSPN